MSRIVKRCHGICIVREAEDSYKVRYKDRGYEQLSLETFPSIRDAELYAKSVYSTEAKVKRTVTVASKTLLKMADKAFTYISRV